MEQAPGADDTRSRLLAVRAETLERVAALRADHARFVAASELSNADDEHDPEGATIAFERGQVTALLLAAQRSLVETDEALARLDAGRYGLCEVCGRAVDPARLEARPAARRCVGCASRRAAVRG